jgi:GT2 family glycosyltransferase
VGDKASCKNSLNNNFSNGGHTDKGSVISNVNLQPFTYINRNAILLSKIIYARLGNVSHNYTHTLGDFNYGLRAQRSGFRCFTTKRYIALCSVNKEMQVWWNPEMRLIKRLGLLNSPKGLKVSEYIKSRKNFWGEKWLIYASKV